MHDKTLSASPKEEFLTHNRIGDHTGDLSGFWECFFFGIFKNCFHFLFLKFLRKYELTEILVFHTSYLCFCA
jgi:hypothetical protein